LILLLLGLSACEHTLVGNATTRGISGGERRRLSLGEALMGDYAVTCFDEVSLALLPSLQALPSFPPSIPPSFNPSPPNSLPSSPPRRKEPEI
jgi:hypothetical protein